MSLHEITIEITQCCPNRCIYCSSLSDASKTQLLDYDTICHIVDDAISLGAKSVSLSGGEPFQHPDIVKIVSHIHSKGLHCLLYTSGIVMEKDGNCKSVPTHILEAIKEKVSKLIVNIESADENIYNDIMGTNFGGFMLMQTTIRSAVALGICVEAHMVPMKVNYLQIPDVVALCISLGVTQLSFLRLVVQGRAAENLQKVLLNEEEHKAAKHLMKKASEQTDLKIRLGVPFRDGNKRVNCMTGICKLDVRYDGKVYPCEAFKNDNLKRIKAEAESVKEKSLKEIYHHSAYLNQVRNLLTFFQTEQTCETCMNQFYIQKD